MHRFIARAQPSFERILLIESGPREVGERALKYLYEVKNSPQVDVLTCFGNAPLTFERTRGTVFSVHDREVVENRTRFIGRLAQTPYTVVAILCTGSPILQRWKWAVAMRTSARLIVMNEEANYFGLDLWNLKTFRIMMRKRLSDSALAQAELSGLMAWLLAPFTLAYLALYTGIVHLRRWARIRKQAAS